MAIHVFPGSRSVEFRVPMKCPWIEIESFLALRKDWIIESLEQFENEPPEPRVTYDAGTLHSFLGEQYLLVLKQGQGKAVITDSQLNVRCRDPNDSKMVRLQLEKFYKKESLPIFEARLDICMRLFPVAVEPSGLRVRKMKARWGSCSRSGELCLNTLLVQKPARAIDFVIMHELCHLRHFAHNRDFYALMDRSLPDWREAEKLLSTKPVNPFQLGLF